MRNSINARMAITLGGRRHPRFEAILSAFIAATLGCSAASGQPSPSESDGRSPAPAEGATGPAATRNLAERVEVAVLEPSDARLEMALPGEIEGKRDARLAAALGGYIERLLVETGDRVRRGQTLLRVDTSMQAARRDQTQVELESAERELDRAERIGAALPQAQHDAAASRVNAARAAHRTAQVAVQRSMITAPFDGVVAELWVEAGEVTPPGAPVLRLVQLDPVKVTVSVADHDVVTLRTGMEAEIGVGARARADTVTGVISHISPAAHMSTRAFAVEIDVPNPDGTLLPGMIADVRLVAPVAQGSVIIRQDWLVTGLDSNGVFVDDGGRARWRALTLGPLVRDQIVVLEGLSRGDRVIITGQRELAEGDAVLVAREGVCCQDGRVVYP